MDKKILLTLGVVILDLIVALILTRYFPINVQWGAKEA